MSTELNNQNLALIHKGGLFLIDSAVVLGIGSFSFVVVAWWFCCPNLPCWIVQVWRGRQPAFSSTSLNLSFAEF